MEIHLILPKSWGDISGSHLVKLARLFLRHKTKPDFLTRCFFFFSGWKPLRKTEVNENGTTFYWFRRGGQKFMVGMNIYTTLVQRLNWITSGFQLTASMPKIKGYTHCNLMLYSVPLEDYLNAENYYTHFAETNKMVALNGLFRTFYKKKKWFASASKAEKYAVFLWFSGVKHMLVNKYPYIFSSGNSTGTASPEETILNLLSALNNGDVTNNEKLFKTHVHECFHELNMKIEQSQKTKK
jgi:hypothetical protein